MPNMSVRPGGISYDQNQATTSTSTESELLRSHLREKCNEALNRLFPDAGINEVSDWNSDDVMLLHAIFELARVARHAETTNPLLPRHTILRVLNKLATATPFQDISSDSLIELEQHLRLLAVALRLYKYERTSLGHKLRDDLYQGITRLSDKFSDDRRNCPPNLRIERWNVAFLLQHCQYILTSIEDSYSLAKTAASKVLMLIDGTLNGYGGQYTEARRLGREVARRHRTRSKWHDAYMRLEDLCFAIYARGVGIESEPAVARDELAELESEEKETSLDLRDALEDELINEPGSHYTLVKGMKRLVGQTTQIAMESGPYEENAEYFKYGILDLMSELCYRIRNRSPCFEEFVAILRLALQNSHKSANLIHRKVIDIYQKILEFAENDGVIYGKLEDCSAIDEWMGRHANEFEVPETSKMYPHF